MFQGDYSSWFWDMPSWMSPALGDLKGLIHKLATLPWAKRNGAYIENGGPRIYQGLDG